MPKIKKLPLNVLELQQHPTLTALLSDDRITQKKLLDIQYLSIKELQCVLDSCPIPVLKTENEGQFVVLAIIPLIKVILSHDAAYKLIASLIIYDEAEPIISTLALIKPALLAPEFRSLPQQLHSRHNNAKSLNLAVPSKKQLSHLAQVSPSSIRGDKCI
ncbi:MULTISPECIES: hypothetical protein [unclassified Pseudoalteromonas]|uniref:hypothetical protein n=1 Tax=unclassified Pseudoalteromonas TaxID=194690 RepID=UPI000CB9F118|nr:MULTISPECIES: hypothetical protein [unclassified Pseudoalteromonas]PLT24723.1 hypothetical protein CXF89_14205 [Pseudoalteromonas sp. MelDa3]